MTISQIREGSSDFLDLLIIIIKRRRRAGYEEPVEHCTLILYNPLPYYQHLATKVSMSNKNISLALLLVQHGERIMKRHSSLFTRGGTLIYPCDILIFVLGQSVDLLNICFAS